MEALSRSSVAPGQIVGRKYRIVRELGRGGMGLVVEAENTDTGGRFAIKILRAAALEDPEMVTRFFREARATAKLRSRFVVTIFDVDSGPNGEPYMVMEYLEGRDLSHEIRQRPSLAPPEVVAWIVQACAGLAAAHRAGIIHRDLKPGNLFLTDGPVRVVKVVDFGVSKTVTDTELTVSGEVVGTANYMSPEQLRASREVDERTDVWALGVILFRALEGRMPFEGSGAQIVARILDDKPASPITRPDVPPDLAAIVMRALEKDPAQRFASMQELSQALLPFAEPLPQVNEAIADLAAPAATPSQEAAVVAPSEVPSGQASAPVSVSVAWQPPARIGGARLLIPLVAVGLLVLIGALFVGRSILQSRTVVAASPPHTSPSATVSAVPSAPTPSASAAPAGEPPPAPSATPKVRGRPVPRPSPSTPKEPSHDHSPSSNPPRL